MSQVCLMIGASEGARERLEAVLARVPLACVMITAGAATDIRPLVEAIQKRNVAAVVVDDIALARAVRADGVHLTAVDQGLTRYHEARSLLGAGAIVGADVRGSRHAAMVLGEAGVDYVAFGPEGELAHADMDVEPMSQAGLLGWWSELFEVPCLALGVANTDMARECAAAGSDFVMLAWPHGVSIADGVAYMEAVTGAVEVDGAPA